MKITAVVVTYNRLELLKECIQKLKQQTVPLNEIIIVNNNSTDGTAEWLTSQTGITIINQDNLGGAGGQYTGMSIAFENGADWIWCMDDDAMPYQDALEKLMPYTADQSIAALACTVIEKDGKKSLQHRGFFDYKAMWKSFGLQPLAESKYSEAVVEIDYATFVGIMVNKNAIAKAGLPKKELFLHFDDIEYSLRIGKHGKIILVPESRILHMENASNHFYNKKVLGKDRVRIRYDKLWMRYYSVRNVTWGMKTYYGKKSEMYPVLLKFFLKSIGGILLFDDHKIKRVKFFTSAFKDGLDSRFLNGYDYIVNKTKLY